LHREWKVIKNEWGLGSVHRRRGKGCSGRREGKVESNLGGAEIQVCNLTWEGSTGAYYHERGKEEGAIGQGKR